MLNRIIEFSIKNKLIIALFIIALIGYGSYEITRLPIDAVPDITNNQVQVITAAPALGAPDIERLITFPIEQVNSNIPGLKQIRSFSRFGLSVVTIVFNDDVDIYWARQQVAERLQDAKNQIPAGSGTPKLAPVTTGLGEIYQYVVRPKKGYENRYSPMDLRTIQDWIVRRQLLDVKGVAEVSSFGGYLKQYEIAVNPYQLSANNITIQDVFAALENNNQNTGGAYIEKGPTLLFIRTEGLVGSIDDIKNIVVKNLGNGTPLLIKDVAEVGFGSATRYGAMTYNGEREVSGAVVMMLKGANSNDVIQHIKQRIEAIQNTLPEGIIIDPFLDRTKMVNNSIHTVEKNLLEGAFIVLFVLILFLGNMRAGFLVASVIPLAMLIAVILMNAFGVSGNLMSLGALDFGLIVDGSIIIVESVLHQLQSQPRALLSKPEMDKTVSSVSARMRNAAVFGEIIILIVYIPIFTLQGIEGKMFIPMAQTVAFALLGAFVLSLTYIPMMSSVLLRKHHSEGAFSKRIMELISRTFESLLKKALLFPKTIILLTVVLFACSLIILMSLGGEFIPALPEGDYAVETRVLPGSSLKTSVQSVSLASKILLDKFPEIEKIVGKTGSSEVPTDPMSIDATDMMVILKDRKEWTSASTYDELQEKMSKELEAVPGVTFGFQYPVAMRFNELLSGARQDVVCKIFGENLDTLAHYAKRLGAVCNGVQGSSELYVESVTGMPQIIVRYNRAMLAQYGLNVSDVNKLINTAFAGQSSGLVFEEEKRFDLVVRLNNDHRKNLEDVQNLLIPTSKGIQLPLSQVASVEIKEGPNQIQRESAQRRIIVGFNVRGRDVESLVNELQQKVEQQIKLPTGYHITYGGAFENLVTAKKRLSIAVPLSLLLIFILLYFAFKSVKQGLLIYSAIPLSATGGIIALALRGIPFSISAGVGFIALFGVAVLNGIVLIAEFNRLKNEGYSDLKQLVIDGTKIRLRPVLMTASVASLGFLPMALSQGEGAEVQRPLATVVIGGLLIATLLTLFVLPILYTLFEGKSRKKPNLGGTAVITFIAAMLLTSNSTAQTPISVKAAIDTALKNNLSLKNVKLIADYREKLKGSAWNISQTAVSLDYGQINSSYTDNKIGIQQTLKFPTVYARQKSVLKAEWEGELLNLNLKETELRKEVTSIFFELLYLDQKKILLYRMDSMYTTFLKNAALRFNKGESNILEKATAESQRGQITIQLLQVKEDYELLLMRFHVLLNTEVDYRPEKGVLKIDLQALADSTNITRHPYLRSIEQQQQLDVLKYKLERSKFLPDLFANYNNMSIKGVGADERFYTGNNRFQSVQVGIGIPLFFRSQQSLMQASKVNIFIAQNEYQIGLQKIQEEYQRILKAYNTSLEIVQYYEKTGLTNSETIIRTANLQFQNGAIDFLEWTILTNNGITLINEYLDAINKLNQHTIQLNAFSNFK